MTLNFACEFSLILFVFFYMYFLSTIILPLSHPFLSSANLKAGSLQLHTATSPLSVQFWAQPPFCVSSHGGTTTKIRYSIKYSSVPNRQLKRFVCLKSDDDEQSERKLSENIHPKIYLCILVHSLSYIHTKLLTFITRWSIFVQSVSVLAITGSFVSIFVAHLFASSFIWLVAWMDWKYNIYGNPLLALSIILILSNLIE